jgi:hypothetical protein
MPQLQSPGQFAQFSPKPLAQMPSLQSGLQLPPWHEVPDAHTPHEPPQPSGPHETPEQEGAQQLGTEPPPPGVHT